MIKNKFLLLLVACFATGAASAATVPLAKMDSTIITFYCGDDSEVNGDDVMQVNSDKLAIPFEKYATWAVTSIVIDPSFKQVKPTSTSNLFSTVDHYLTELTSITGLENLNTEDVTDMSRMFFSCEKITALDLSGLNTSKVTDMNQMFYNCKGLQTLNIKGFDTQNVTDMHQMFSDCSSLTSLDVSGLDTKSATDMSQMFSYCSSLTSLDVSGFNTSNVTNMYAMFSSCNNLKALDVSNFDTKNVTDSRIAFAANDSIKELNLGKNDFSNVVDLYKGYMFSNIGTLANPCKLIIDRTGDDGFDVSVLGETRQNDAGQSYYQWSGGYFVIETGTPTGITQVNAAEQQLDANAPAYNLQGQRVSGGYRGVVIQNGRKYIRK